MRYRTILGVTAASLLTMAAALSAEPAADGGKKVSTTLTGAAEVPGPGDADGSGTFSATINPGQGRLCYELTATGIAAPTAAHIHTGTSSQAGPVLIGLTTPTGTTTFTSSGCITTLSRADLDAIRKSPQAFYVNVHNTPFPGGAIRGQL
ncbi:MAG: CHRD domain-containing protein [Sphingomicrobium sp.]